MPFYSLICRRCGHSFEKQASIAQRSGRAISCPECGGTDLDPDYSTGKSAAIRSAAPQGGEAGLSGCPHAAGCGCCGCGGGRQ